jgi:hypothetical protein
VLVNGRPFTVVGIVPESFRGVYALVEFDAYLPHGMLPSERRRWIPSGRFDTRSARESQ